MILNIITFVVCFFMLVLFRKMDKSNLRMSKLRRYSSKIFDDFKKLTESESRKFRDATIEMDILIKKSNSLTKNLGSSLKEIEIRLNGLDIEKTNLKKVEEDLKVISRAARDVNKQIEFIGAAREDFSFMTEKITVISETFEGLKGESMNLTRDFNDKIRERSREMTEEMEARLMDEGSTIIDNLKNRVEVVARSVEGASNLNSQIDSIKGTLADLESTVFSDIRDKSEEMKTEINKSVERVYGKLNNVEANIDESKDRLIRTFQDEVDRIRTELDNLSIHAISKKDEIVQASRKEAEEIRKKIEDFEEKYSFFERNLVDLAQDKADMMESKYAALEARSNNSSEKAMKEISVMEQRLLDIKNEILLYEEKNRIFFRTDEMMKKVDDSLRSYERILEVARVETQNLERFFDNAEEFKEVKKDMEREIRAYQIRKEKLNDMEREVRGLMELTDMVVLKTDEIKNDISKVDTVHAKINALSDSYTNLEARIHELQEYEDIIAKNLDSVIKMDITLQAMDGKIKNFQKVIERSDKRVDKITEHLHKVEENTIFLKSRESDIQEVKDKFNEIDGLSAHIEKRIDQIYAMFQKIETLKQEIDATDSRLQGMFTETDRKMKQFADFIHAVDSSPITKQVKKETPLGKNITENMIGTVRELSRKGWASDEIARKLLIDENSVRLIINTASL